MPYDPILIGPLDPPARAYAKINLMLAEIFGEDEGDLSSYESHDFVIGDTDAAPVVTGNEFSFHMPYTARLTHPDGGNGIRASLKVASTAGPVEFDILMDGVSIFSTKPTFDEDEVSLQVADVPSVVSEAVLDDDAKITIIVTADGTDATGLKVWMVWRRFDTNLVLFSGDEQTTGNDAELLSGDETDGNDAVLQNDGG